MEQKPVVNFKNIEINGRTFILKKMDARTGSYILFTKIIKFLPAILENLDFDKLDFDNFTLGNLSDLNLTKIFEPIFNLPENDFRYIQDNCLKAVSESLPAGPQPILNKNGEWGIADIEFDMSLVMNLTVQSLWFSLEGFFAGLPFNSIMKNVSSFQQNAKI